MAIFYTKSTTGSFNHYSPATGHPRPSNDEPPSAPSTNKLTAPTGPADIDHGRMLENATIAAGRSTREPDLPLPY